ncbi:T9SS type A sorting domain-containing protein [Flavobacterium ovatum]|uniref:T9SS type A sorting domain-containing protein n=1 Tax=Flavobacterium ovatum TaxID=1928857 RepID=UPI00344CEB03
MKKFKLSVLAAFCFISTISQAQLRVGDPGVTINQTAIDANSTNYPQMSRWANAGVIGGIPFVNDANFEKKATINAGNSAAINTAIVTLSNSLTSGQKGLLTLNDGNYTIDASITMKSNVSLIGQTREGVICTITMVGGNAFTFYNVSKCGIYNLTIQGGWGTPVYAWNYSLDENREITNDNVSVRLSGTTNNCWLDKVTILNSANDPLRCVGEHITLRDLIVDGCHRKAGGAEGYFFIQSRDNLITGCKVTHVRHISLQGSNVEYNVVYDNDFKQEISFHSGDNGNNLIEFNNITLPVDMPPVDASEPGPAIIKTNAPDYFAIMGPWSSQHTNSNNPNFVYRNSCLQNNHTYSPTNTPWSDDSKVYYGPKKIAIALADKIVNFPEYSVGIPSGKTLYAVTGFIPKNTNLLGTTEINLKKKIETISPNPFTSRLKLVLNEGHQYNKVSLISSTGKVVIMKNISPNEVEMILNVEILNLSAGVYILNLTGNSSKSIKLIKK